jgi:hypothetical protein
MLGVEFYYRAAFGLGSGVIALGKEPFEQGIKNDEQVPASHFL